MESGRPVRVRPAGELDGKRSAFTQGAPLFVGNWGRMRAMGRADEHVLPPSRSWPAGRTVKPSR